MGRSGAFDDTLVFFVDNPRVNDLSLTITVEFEDDVDFIDASFEESITVSSQSNETFSIELTTSDAEEVRSHAPTDKITIVVTAERTPLPPCLRRKSMQISKSPAIINSCQK
jgi:hypothetical protein